jgi:hypothetical protein
VDVEWGKGGPRLKVESTTILAARNAADGAYSILRCATPSGNDDAVTKLHHDNAIATTKRFHGIVARSTAAGLNCLPTHITSTTFTLGTTANPLTYYHAGTSVAVAADKTATLDDGAGGTTAGLYYVRFNAATGNLLALKTHPGVLFGDNVLVASILWNGTNYGLVCDERHGYNRDHAWHAWAHFSVGVRYHSGFDFVPTGTGAGATFTMGGGDLWDEDIQFSAVASSSYPTAHTLRCLYQTGALTYGFDAVPSAIPYRAGTNSRPTYVRAVGYALSTVPSSANRYVNFFIYGIQDMHTPVYCLCETVNETVYSAGGYTSPANARAVPWPNLTTFGLSPEMRPLYRLVVRADGAVQALTAANDYRTVSSLPQAAGTVATSASAVTFTAASGIESTNVQLALEELDAEKANTALSNLTNVAINTTLVPGSDDGAGLGDGTHGFSDVFVASGGVLNWANGDITITHSSNLLTLDGGDLALGANNLTLTGAIASTGSRASKGWFEDLESTSGIVLGIDAATNTAGYVKLFSAGANAYYTTITAGEQTGNCAYTMPLALPGGNRFLQCTSGGVLSWEVGGGGAAASITVADETADTTSFLVFVTAATGDLGPKSNTTLTYNASTQYLGATGIVVTGNGSASTAQVVNTLYGTDAAPSTAGIPYGSVYLQYADASPEVLHNALSDLNVGDYKHLTATEYTDLTDGGTTTLHVHAVPTTITLANEATDTTCFVLFGTAATGDLGPKTNVALTFNSNTGALASTLFAANTITANTAFVPDANDGAALGTTALQFSDVFIAEGGVINWDNGDVTLTHVGNLLTLAGGDLALSGSSSGTCTLKATAASGTSVQTFQAVTGNVYCSGGTDIAYTDGGTGISTYPTRTILLLAGAATLGTTTPATRETREMATNKQAIDVLKFAVAGTNIAWFNFPIPDAYDSGTFIISVYYFSLTSEAANFRFQAAMSAAADAEAMDVSLGTTVLVTAACSGTALYQKVATFGAVTASPTPAPAHMMFLKLWRDPTEGSDNSTLDAYVSAIKIEFVANAWTD